VTEAQTIYPTNGPSELRQPELILFEEVLGHIADIKSAVGTGAGRIEISGEEANGKYRDIVDSFPLPAGILDFGSGEILHVNSAARESGLQSPDKSVEKAEVKSWWLDLPEREALIAELKSGSKIRGREIKVDYRNGEYGWIMASFEQITFESREALFLSYINITREKEYQAEVAASEKRYQDLVDKLPMGVVVHSTGAIRYANPAAVRMLGAADVSGLIDLPILDFVVPEERQKITERVERVLSETKGAEISESSFLRLDGSRFFAKAQGIPVEFNGVPAVQVVFEDISELKSSTEALYDSQMRMARMAEATFEGLIIHDGVTVIDANQTLADMLGYEIDELVGMDVLDITAPSRRHDVTKRINENEAEIYTSISVRKDGSEFPVEVSVKQQKKSTGVLRIVAIRDVSERLIIEAEQKEREKVLAEAQRIGQIGHWRLFINDQMATWSDQMYRLYGMEPAPDRVPLDFILSRIHPDDREQAVEAREHGFETRQKYEFSYRIMRGDGTVRYISGVGEPEFDENDQVVSIFGITRDITDQRLSEMESEASEMEFQALLDAAPVALMVTSEQRLLYANAAAHEILLASDGTLAGQNSKFRFADQDFRRELIAELEEVGSINNVELQVVRDDGSKVWILMNGKKVLHKNQQANFVGFVDNTDQRATEMQLRQSQKMEAVGQLTGGVAHDFNNLLAVILGNAEMVMEQVEAGDAVEPALVEAIQKSAERGSGLTNHLLAFSRSQTLAKNTVHLAKNIEGMADMLRRTLGETITINIKPETYDWMVVTDAGQIENAVLNLSLNARDAMPEGGTLTIEVLNIHLQDVLQTVQGDIGPGDFVVLSVSDTGVGMPKSAVDRAFEPFFTTKEVGKGTGLGLSMVFGFAQQSGGVVTISSEVGLGTTVKLYLPRARLPGELEADEPSTEIRKAGNEKILVLEDSPDVRHLVVSLLQGLGYQTVEAPDGPGALALLDAHPDIRLLLSDVVLPGGASGPDVARLALKINPAIKVLYMSGYTDNAVLHGGHLKEEAPLLHKPFRKKELAQKIQEILHGVNAG
jgi:PAS domain S-box-containing protein